MVFVEQVNERTTLLGQASGEVAAAATSSPSTMVIPSLLSDGFAFVRLSPRLGRKKTTRKDNFRLSEECSAFSTLHSTILNSPKLRTGLVSKIVRCEPWERSHLWVGMNWASTGGISGTISDEWQRCMGCGGFLVPLRPHVQMAVHIKAQQVSSYILSTSLNSRLQGKEILPLLGQKVPANHSLHLHFVDLLKWGPNVSLLSITLINGS